MILSHIKDTFRNTSNPVQRYEITLFLTGRSHRHGQLQMRARAQFSSLRADYLLKCVMICSFIICNKLIMSKI